MKQCIRCNGIFPLERYYSDKSKKDGKTPYCQDCRREKARIQNDKNPQLARDRARRARDRDRLAYDLARMGLTKKEYFWLVTEQEGRCAICGEEEALTLPSGEKRRLSVDHDHKCCEKKRDICGMCNRGLLCNRCNRMLGMINDDIDLLKEAVNYLERYS